MLYLFLFFDRISSTIYNIWFCQFHWHDYHSQLQTYEVIQFNFAWIMNCQLEMLMNIIKEPCYIAMLPSWRCDRAELSSLILLGGLVLKGG